MKLSLRYIAAILFLLALNMPTLAQKASLTETLDWLKGRLNEEYPVALRLPSDEKL